MYSDPIFSDPVFCTPGHLIVPATAYVADSREQAIQEAGPYALYFSRTLFSHGNFTEASLQQQHGYLSHDSHDYARSENRAARSGNRSRFRDMTLQDIEGNDRLAWGRPDEMLEKLLAEAEALGSNTLLLSFNRGAMPHEMFRVQLQRFGEEALPALRAHEVTKAPV